MASLDVLDYQAGLDDALAKPGPDGRPLLPPGLRKQAVREARRLIDAMAFRFALIDERPLPEDLDYAMAVEAMKPPERAAEVLARKRPVYARVRRRRLVTSFTILGILLFLVLGIAYLATLEESVTLVDIQPSAARDVTFSVNETFEVTEDLTRLRVEAQVIMGRDSRGAVDVFLVDPSGRPVLHQTFTPGGNLYLRENVLDPQPGEWRLIVDFLEAHGSATVTVRGVRPST